MVNQQQAHETVLGWQRSMDALFEQQQQRVAVSVPQQGPDVLGTIGDGIEAGLTGLASFGQAALNRPELVLEVAAGAGLAVAGGAIATGGVVLDATGVGAVVGVPANIAGAGMVVSGAGLALHGTHQLVEEARMNPADPIQFDAWWGKSQEEKAEETRQQVEDHRRESKEAADKAMENLNGKLPKAPSPWWFDR